MQGRKRESEVKIFDCWPCEISIASHRSIAGATMRRSTFLAVAALSACLSGCATTEETPLAPNFVRLDTRAPFTSELASQTMQRAAELTLRNGYTDFRLTPMYWTSFSVGVLVVMFHAGEAGAFDAFDARTVLANRSQ